MIKLNRKFKLFFILIPTIFLTPGCTNINVDDNEKGYEDAWDDKDKPSSLWISQEEIDGYEQGRYDSDMYDDGYYDGCNNLEPKFTTDLFYMDGYKDGKDSR